MALAAQSPARVGSVARVRELPALILLVAMLLWLALTKPAFRAPANLAQVSQESAQLGIMACGEALVILTGGIDLSVGAALAMCSCAAASRMLDGWPWPAAVLLGLAMGAVAGGLNGALITYRRMPPILVTLATLLLYRALTNVLTGAVPYIQLPTGFKALGQGYLPFAVFAVLTASFAVLLARSRFGRRLVAVGGSEQAARLSGLPVDRILRRVYIISGMCAAVSGLLMSASANNAQWSQAEGFELQVIAAVVIGGVRLSGGEGSVIGAALGALLIVLMQNAMILNGVPKEYYGLITGAAILIAAFVEQFRRSRSVGVMAVREA